ncbi:hypothetical protein PPL_06732 [Heterostelium album PN500]|uniref:Uncharacterized protein n=1 Tax=Heterostelium pallidum (strain ATCC 26659 / Pp 5 / PN500) TaxID=670386 RepID=D3BFJ4_HETP5|nr:hypothetical protein PPL_06728 [Heterostelium album PN500]XP_020432033.1 hypothetical protein PPL_06732 [Heterostelium album PN500]EFA79908.1 hypothetical protein PPL_06728 [Heterostelium album PN500]EFA79912.1 hypothetical protein PPL_06732 [Heterostelium album PN500]|eukprot:XP_020432029.1 hypothetical protein PPL_06728 [Heterostelium album PN500]
MNIIKTISIMLIVMFLMAMITARPCCESCREDDERCQYNCIDCNRPTTFQTVPPWPEPTSFPSTTKSSTTGSTTK